MDFGSAIPYLIVNAGEAKVEIRSSSNVKPTSELTELDKAFGKARKFFAFGEYVSCNYIDFWHKHSIAEASEGTA